MVIFAGIVYFVLVCGFIGLMIFANAREALVRWVNQKRVQIYKKCDQLRLSLAPQKNAIGSVVNNAVITGWHRIAQHLWLLMLAVGLLTLPPLLVWLFNNKNMLDGFDDKHIHNQNDQVTALLLGERIVPPTALPPEMFETQEVLRIRPSLIDASRNWLLLDSDFSQRVLLVFRIMKERYGYDMVILEGYRSPQRQNQLASMGSSVTNAKAFQSYHQFGLAVDCAFMRNGKLLITEKDPWAMHGYQLYGEVAESLGLRWGGRWKMMDFGHVEMSKPNTLKH